MKVGDLHFSWIFVHFSFLNESVGVLFFESDLKNKWHLVVDRLTVLFLKFLEYFHKLQLFIWWLLEIHIIKIVSCYIVLVSIKEVGKRAATPPLQERAEGIFILTLFS